MGVHASDETWQYRAGCGRRIISKANLCLLRSSIGALQRNVRNDSDDPLLRLEE